MIDLKYIQTLLSWVESYIVVICRISINESKVWIYLPFHVNYFSVDQPANIFSNRSQKFSSLFSRMFSALEKFIARHFSEGLIVLMCSIYGEIFLLDKDDNFYRPEQFKFLAGNCPIKSLGC